MRRARVAVAGVAVLAAGLALPAAASGPAHAPLQRVVPVTGQVLTVQEYSRLGLSPQQVALHLQLDRFAADGVDRRLLNTALVASTASSTSQVIADDLVDVGNLNAAGPVELAEERYTADGSGQSLQLVVRDGLTGAPLWHRTDRVSGKKLLFAFGGPVGAAGKPGVLVWVDDYQANTADVTALDGSGKQVWHATIVPPRATPPPAAPPVGLGDSGSEYLFGTLFSVGVPLRKGPLDIVQMSFASEIDSGTLGDSQSGAIAFGATSLANGASRSLPGGTTSSSGTVAGDVVDDADGDGFDDLVVADGGAGTVKVLRANDGSQVWSSTFSGELLGAYGISSVTGQAAGRHLTEDIALVTQASPGPLATGAPTPSVSVLGGHTGALAWKKPGSQVYLVGRVSGHRALGLLDDQSDASATTATAKGVLTVYDQAGRTVWTKSYATSRSTQSGFAFAYAETTDDFGRDGSREAVVHLVTFDDRGDSDQPHVVDGRTGNPLPALQQQPLFGFVRPGHEALVSSRTDKRGLTVVVFDAVTRAQVWASRLPDSTGTSSSYVFADHVARRPCSDLVVQASGARRAVVGVLASSGAPRWTVSWSSGSSALGAVRRPASAPRVSC